MDEQLLERMRKHGIDTERSQEILTALNDGAYDNVQPLSASGLPSLDGKQIVDRRGTSSLEMAFADAREKLAFAPEIPLGVDRGTARLGTVSGDRISFTHDDLRSLGTLLYPYLAYGVLNGGSATSYADRTKNDAFDRDLLKLYREEFARLADTVTGQPKGITPAYLNPDGSPGASFLELKFRMVLRAADAYSRTAASFNVTPPKEAATAEPLLPAMPMVEMTSVHTEESIRDAYRRYQTSPLLAGHPYTASVLETAHAVQPLLAAMTHSSEGRPRRFFAHAHGHEGEPLGIPGGHGQNFHVLQDIYRDLAARGKRFVYLGNVDNIGFTIDPVSLALLALRGSDAGFDFAFRTPVDVKGGILIRDEAGHLNCGDIGPAISKDEVLAAEEAGTPILFNCASGLFRLDRLTAQLEQIIINLPMRISDQEKDAGRYSQAEQVTWEVIGLLDDVLIFGIDKYRRFLAAKMLLDTLLTSGLHHEAAARIQPSATRLAAGLRTVLAEEYGMVLRNGVWEPEPWRAG